MIDADQRLASLPAKRVRTAFWCLFFLILLFTGILQYQFQPNESYDERRHELVASHWACENTSGVGRCADIPDVWRDKKTNETFTPVDFLFTDERKLSVRPSFGLHMALSAASRSPTSAVTRAGIHSTGTWAWRFVLM